MNHQIKKQTVLLVLTSCIYVVILFCLQIWVSRYPVGRIQEIKYFIIFIPYISYVLVGLVNALSFTKHYLFWLVNYSILVLVSLEWFTKFDFNYLIATLVSYVLGCFAGVMVKFFLNKWLCRSGAAKK